MTDTTALNHQSLLNSMSVIFEYLVDTYVLVYKSNTFLIYPTYLTLWFLNNVKLNPSLFIDVQVVQRESFKVRAKFLIPLLLYFFS